MFSATIKDIKARQVFDSRGNPTVEAEVITDGGSFRAICPSGASTGIYEAHELRDGGDAYMGKGVSIAVKNIRDIIRPALIGKDACNQFELDKLMIEDLDGSKNDYGWNKKNLGANAILSVSMALARAAAHSKKVPLYRYLAQMAGEETSKFIMPVPSFNVINGGQHAENTLGFQEFMIMPIGAKTFTEAMQIGVEVYHSLKKVIKKKFGASGTNVGDEGGFAPNVNVTGECIELLLEAIEEAGHTGKIGIALDAAASEFYDADSKTYNPNYKVTGNKDKLSGEDMCKLYADLVEKYPIISIEDPFD